MDLSSNSKVNCSLTTMYYGVYVPNEAKDFSAPPNVFQDKLEALKVAKKNKKSRFKAFQFYHEAAEFALNGLDCPNNNTFIEKSEHAQAIGEKTSPFKGPKPQELVELRKAIEIGNFKYVKDIIWQNPRYLVSSGDTPSILQEGPRYNALHVAAKSKNAEITELILSTISNVEFIKLLYGDDNEQNAIERIDVLVDLYLNTPNKGLNETPLHFASKHGAVEVVEILVSHPQCDKTLKNKFQKTAAEIVCERAECDNIQAVKRKIELLLKDSYYVPVLRAEDNSMPPLVGEPFTPVSPPVLNKDPLSSRLEIHAYAGPMDVKEAHVFRKIWKTPPRSLNFSSPNKANDMTISSLRYKDPDKGLERIGKKLANKYEVNWKEYWPFLGSFVDISSEEGLNLLESHLLRRHNDSISSILERSDILSPVSNLCVAFSACSLTDNSLNFQKNQAESLKYLDKACQVFTNRISNDILYILCSEDDVIQVLEIEIRQLELLILSYMEDERFCCYINFQKIHSRLGILVGRKLHINLKEEVRTVLCTKLEILLDNITKNLDYFSSDDECHILEPNPKPTVYKKQLFCLTHFILATLIQNVESKRNNQDDYVKEWDNAEACSCIYHSRKTKRISLSRSGSFKNNFHSPRVPRKLSFGDVDQDQNFVRNGFNSNLSHNCLEFSSDEESDKFDDFYTPPTSPVSNIDSESEEEFYDTELPEYDVFIESNYPTKLDSEVFNALNVAEIFIDKTQYPSIYKWHHRINLYSTEEREKWPSINERNTFSQTSPNNSLNSSFCSEAPRTSTPSKSWLRITGANSPKRLFKSSNL